MQRENSNSPLLSQLGGLDDVFLTDMFFNATHVSWMSASSDSRNAPSGRVPSSRVCDRCIWKKVKCDLQRPSCSRCREVGWPCVYSSTRRKPGPPLGSHRKASSRPAPGTLQRTVTLEENEIPPGAGSPWMGLAVGETHNRSSQGNDIALSNLPLHPQDERQILDDFFEYIHPSAFLFRKEEFFRQFQRQSLSPNLLQTIFAVSLKILNPPTIDPAVPIDLESLRNTLSNSNSVLQGNGNGPAPLDVFQQACLLAYYEFHQHPGSRAWLRIGQLTREAYRCGLHQLDNRNQCPLYSFFGDIPADQLEEWRRVWWFVYCLDSYSNITAGTPFVIETDSIQTALFGATSADESNASGRIFLPPDTGELWKTTKNVVTRGQEINLNLHLVTAMVLREAATLRRLRAQESSDRLDARLCDVKDHLSSVRLALPARYLSPSRNTVSNESQSEHHDRMICILHLHIARILMSLPPFPAQEANTADAAWFENWLASLEYCEDVVSVVREWDGSFSSRTDPAVCLIVFTALIVLYLHQECQVPVPNIHERVAKHNEALELFLDQFASLWHLPAFLKVSVEKFKQRYPGPLDPATVEQIIRQFTAPLHWQLRTAV
ncbi:hypothetical protein VTN96DRAFT_8565 [Rasamsonia emersonii]